MAVGVSVLVACVGCAQTAERPANVTGVTSAASAPTAPVTPVARPAEAVPPSSTGVPQSVAGLAGRSFQLVGLITDASGIDTMSKEAAFVLHFVDGAATADTQCGQLTYPSVKYSTGPGVGDLRVDLGDFSGPTCVLGADPADPPSGLLGFGVAGSGEFFLSTGYVGWRFREIGN